MRLQISHYSNYEPLARGRKVCVSTNTACRIFVIRRLLHRPIAFAYGEELFEWMLWTHSTVKYCDEL